MFVVSDLVGSQKILVLFDTTTANMLLTVAFKILIQYDLVQQWFIII